MATESQSVNPASPQVDQNSTATDAPRVWDGKCFPRRNDPLQKEDPTVTAKRIDLQSNDPPQMEDPAVTAKRLGAAKPAE